MIVLLGAVLVAVSGASPVRALELQSPRWSRARMEAGRADAPPFLFVYGTQVASATPVLRAQALRVARRAFGADSTRVLADREVSETRLAAGPVFLFGGPAENEWTRRLAPALPVRFEPRGFRWQGRLYDAPGDAIQLSWPHPLAPERFLLLLAGNSPSAFVPRGGFLDGDDDWRIVRAEGLARSGRFAHDGGKPWRYDPTLDRDREAERARYDRALRDVPARALRIRAPERVGDAAAVASAADALLDRMTAEGWPTRATAPRPVLVLHPSLEEKGRQTRVTRPEHLADATTAHLARPFGRTTPDLWSVAALRLRQGGAVEGSRFLVPAAVRFAGRFEGEPLETAIARLYAGGLLPTAADAATRDSRWRSPLVRVPARALLVEAVIASAPPGGRVAALAALLRRDPPGTLDSLARVVGVPASTLATRYRALAEERARSGRRALVLDRRAPWRPTDGFQRGVCLAHEVGLERGYLSAECARQLARIRESGANTVSLTPFAWLFDLREVEMGNSTDAGPDGESDEALVEAAARARALGLRVWLKPHLWTRGWSGDLSFTPTGWARFLDAWEEHALHWALLAERERMDGFMVGHELASATAADPARFRALVGRVRRVYGGLVSYVANWDEVERIPFWDALDLVSVSFYTPLAEAPTRDAATLRAGATRALAALEPVARRAGRPVLIAELGFAPSGGAAVRPWESGEGPEDLETQRACLAAVVSASEPFEWLAGVHFWKWGTTARPGGDPFDTKGRPAGTVVTDALRIWQGRPVRVPAPPPPARTSPGGRR